jgi:hypothetical protein
MTKRKIALERRHFLQLVGASALTYPFLRGVPSFAAASGTPPTYLVLLFTPCGCVRPLWGATDASGKDVLPPAAGSAPTQTTNFIFRNTLAPFAMGGKVTANGTDTSWTTNLSSKVIILDGLDNKAAQGSHEAGMAALWTGQISTGASATSISIDQQIAGLLKAGTPFPTIQLQVRDPIDYSDREVKTRMIYNSAGVFVDPIDNPTAALSTLFPTMTTTKGPDKTSFIRQQLFGSSSAILNGELNGLMPKLCTEDRTQLQALQDGWNNLYSQLQAAATAAASCMTPTGITASTDFPTNAKLQMDILALALACDLTRVASLQFSTSTSQVTHKWLGTNQTETHHTYSHQGPGGFYNLCWDKVGCTSWNSMGQCTMIADVYNTANLAEYNATVPPSLAMQQAIDLFYGTQVAYFAQRLNGLTGMGGSGSGTLLDQSVVCWGNELDMGSAHNHDNTPFLLMGGANGKLKTGQMVTFPLDQTGASSTSPPKMDRSHNDLLLTLAQVMGTPLSTFGEKTFCTGPITQLLSS